MGRCYLEICVFRYSERSEEAWHFWDSGWNLISTHSVHCKQKQSLNMLQRKPICQVHARLREQRGKHHIRCRLITWILQSKMPPGLSRLVCVYFIRLADVEVQRVCRQLFMVKAVLRALDGSLSHSPSSRWCSSLTFYHGMHSIYSANSGHHILRLCTTYRALILVRAIRKNVRSDWTHAWTGKTQRSTLLFVFSVCFTFRVTKKKGLLGWGLHVCHISPLMSFAWGGVLLNFFFSHFCCFI